ncbi:MULTISPECIES: tRNA (adenosine(37)-N6)-threonylcarbamoyltransferase complex dimerization subunit type 1 TsaB [Faecalicoccus]|uniref:tRNA (adenosine(37)-N6)-threonylcarbamoyltransferase complex dimerization subunit type 1 TsaB n=1 Tax=Faecalicoccus TaxID=1573536 RepID=UPI0018977055|nr:MULTISPECIES: tRNA (adenosine(37)-N6)-threonylcarbamoyltransferase complex dimerization subunit type 1 TsaB [Faecalicoccus]MCI6379948.1 tRNA (adenosine(37)-N6)-threonylcarbamoyltransferase complex dimerization subunit type 1 TsaB [Erysipelotrichaceae bacterium]MDB7983483.1 tRNA (adenosine(37)-N6)-threonylcarbamoyltransferase complex dimerization subunit type 1 TsaB [Faecalicoccus pleomorphus]MDY4870177.1 tRNA (adenosine(37)-N6)-threonylcarbamoyltransferase complex dimerization subunit type 1 
MISLCMDSAYKQLVLGLYKDQELLAGISLEAFKKQSETIFVELNRLLKETNLDYKDIDRVIITKGPGSYTGIRIAMTIAKVLCSQMHKELYTISTMQLYAGIEKQANVILDARSQRAYVAHLEDGQIQGNTQILTLDEVKEFIETNPGIVLGDADLMGQDVQKVDFLKNFIELEPYYEKVENIHALVPDYLKESDSYKV